MKEILLRWKEPLNSFWKRALIIFGLLGSAAALATEFILPLLMDPELSHDAKDILRPLYGLFLGIASAARFTVASTEMLKEKKHKAEFQDKVDNPPAPGVYSQNQFNT